MSEMIERVARALCKADGRDPDRLEPGSTPCGGEDEFIDGELKGGPAFLFWRVYVPDARAAIEAMREPSGGVLDAIDDPEAPYVSRRNKANPPGRMYEVVHMTGADWREVISDDREIVGQFATQEEADELCADLAAKWRWSAMIDAALARTPG